MLRYHRPPACSELLDSSLDAWSGRRPILDTGETSVVWVAWRGVRTDPDNVTLIIPDRFPVLVPFVPLGKFATIADKQPGK